MKRIVTCSEMKALDNHTINEKQVPSCVLMERAALETVRVVEDALKGHGEKEQILFVCGFGNNGGDGIAAARILHLHGFKSAIYFPGDPISVSQETALQLKIAESYQVPVTKDPKFENYTVIIDALFGIGLKRNLEGKFADCIQKLNQTKALKIAVDIPSGINGDTGEVMGNAFQADITVTFGYRKMGLCLFPGRFYAGKVITADAGIYADDDRQIFSMALSKEDLNLLPQRIPYGNKGTFGKVLAVAGSFGMCGAACLCASASFASGAGMVRILSDEANRIPVHALLPEAIFTSDNEEKSWEESFAWCDVLIIGPGLSTSETGKRKTEWFLKKAKTENKTVIMDADSLNLLAKNPSWKTYLGKHAVLTPHMGEMSRLTGKSVEQLTHGRINILKSYCEDIRATVVLKDACTITCAPSGEVYLNLSGNAGMATAGSGDVLSGILAGTFCRFLNENQSRNPAATAALGVYIHGRAGDLAAEKIGVPGMKASDILQQIPAALHLN